MTNKIPEKLMKEFAEVCGLKFTGIPGLRYSHEWRATNGSEYDLNDTQTIINIAAEWCAGHKLWLEIEQENTGWHVHVACSGYSARHTNLPRAIMTAVVSAAKPTKEAGR